MEYSSRKKFQTIITWSVFCVLELQAWCISADRPQNETGMPAQSPLPSPSSYYFLVEGDTNTAGLFHAVVHVGDSLKEFFLDIDTCSDLTWITCFPGNNVKLLKPISIYATPHEPYTTGNNLVSCEDHTICGLVDKPVGPQCSQQYQQCDYQIQYADNSLTLGVLVNDSFLLSSSLHVHPSYSTSLTFGCGYHQEYPPAPFNPPSADGILAVGNGKTSFLSQLNDQGLIKKVVAFCLSQNGPGYLALGDSQSDAQGIIWMPISDNNMELNNMLGPAAILYDGTALASGLMFLFDSGATYHYFDPKTYEAVLSWLTGLAEKVATPTQDTYLPVCWKPLTSSKDVVNYFSSLRFSFMGNNDIYFELESDDYLVVSPQDNVCVGILNGQELGPELENVNIVGDIGMLDKLMVFDYENQKIGSASRDCTQLPKQLSLREAGPGDDRSGKQGGANRHKKSRR